MDYQVFFGLTAAIVGLIGYIPYVIGLYKGTVRPHVFSWIIWGTLMLIGYFAQDSDNAGAGAWVTGTNALLVLGIAIFAFWRGEKHITRSDWVTFAAALSAIPVWLITENALYAILIVIIIDLLGFYPTIRKCWNAPDSETVSLYLLSGLKWIISIPAMENFSYTTLLYPLSLILMNWLFIPYLYLRKRQLGINPA